MKEVENKEIRSGIAWQYEKVRSKTAWICSRLETEDYVVQPMGDISPPKWHLGHTTWFFETFILRPYMPGYREYDKSFNYVFNSYYESLGNRVIRTDRGNLSRPTVESVYHYRGYVDEAMQTFLKDDTLLGELTALVDLGINHEQQHQELLWTDIKYILGHNPLFPPYSAPAGAPFKQGAEVQEFISIAAGIYEIGFEGEGFSWDNERGRHKVYLNSYEMSTRLVTNQDYLEFMNSGGYHDFRHWHADGWAWVNAEKAEAPLYWHLINGKWFNYTLHGLANVNPNTPVCHINYYEAYAYANWKGFRLPTEFEWEVAASNFSWGERWEWTGSAYLPYPGFEKADGALGEYNGKFMVNQQVLRGASKFTSEGHSRFTYRNFFQASMRWQFTGIRLAK